MATGELPPLRRESPLLKRLAWAAALPWVCWTLGASASTEQSSAPQRLNVILISLDTVRPDHLSCYGYHRKTTPNLDRIAQEGIRFTRAFSQGTWTFPSHMAIFTSQYPMAAWLQGEPGDVGAASPTLTEVLKRHGYTTAAFTNFGRSEYLRPLVASRVVQAFDTVVGGVELRAIPEDLFDWLKAHREGPFFLFLHGYDAHEPHVLPIRYDAKRFNPGYQGRVPSTSHEYQEVMSALLSVNDLDEIPEPERFRRYQEAYRAMFAPLGHARSEEVEHLTAVYDAQLYYLDQGLGQLFVALKNLHLMEHTLLVIVSDHGQMFGEHGRYVEHGWCYDEVTRMVLIIRDPRLKRRARRLHQIVEGSVDLMPTILELLKLPVPEGVAGRSLAPLLWTGRDPSREELAVSLGRWQRAIRSPQWKLINVGRRTELYHIASDPQEQWNLIDRYPDVAATLQQHLDAIVPAEAVGSLAELDQWMQEHGYW